MKEENCEHQFEARYDIVETKTVFGDKILPWYTKSYVCDICCKCGKMKSRISSVKIEIPANI